jgi:hypothetical protein
MGEKMYVCVIDVDVMKVQVIEEELITGTPFQISNSAAVARSSMTC